MAHEVAQGKEEEDVEEVRNQRKAEIFFNRKDK
jgi:hypothetical protein